MKDLYTFDPLLNGVKGLVFIGDKILVYRRDTKTNLYPLKLDIPGGGAEENETPFETFKREVFEEFGLMLEPENIIYWRKYPSANKPGKIAYFPVAKLPENVKSKIKFGDEGLEWFLMDAQDYVESNDSADYLVKRTKDYLEQSSKPSFTA